MTRVDLAARASVRARSAYSAGWLLLAVLTVGSLLGLAACSDLSASLLPDSAIYATATVCACHCYPYGSYPHTTPSATPTGSWVPPTHTPTPTPTRPPAGCDYCTLPPAPTQTPRAWPPPIVTCTPRPDQPTLTPVPMADAPLFPTFPPNTPLPAVLGSTNPVALGSFEGQAQPGAVTTDPRTGPPYAIWSQAAGALALATTLGEAAGPVPINI